MGRKEKLVKDIYNGREDGAQRDDATGLEDRTQRETCKDIYNGREDGAQREDL